MDLNNQHFLKSLPSDIVEAKMVDNYELGDRKSKFDWLDFINKEPKF